MRTVKCNKCDRMFKDQHGLKQHMADIHREGKRPRAEERYPLTFEVSYSDEYEPRQFPAVAQEDDF